MVIDDSAETTEQPTAVVYLKGVRASTGCGSYADFLLEVHLPHEVVFEWEAAVPCDLSRGMDYGIASACGRLREALWPLDAKLNEMQAAYQQHIHLSGE